MKRGNRRGKCLRFRTREPRREPGADLALECFGTAPGTVGNHSRGHHGNRVPPIGGNRSLASPKWGCEARSTWTSMGPPIALSRRLETRAFSTPEVGRDGAPDGPSDFQCGRCGQAHPAVGDLEALAMLGQLECGPFR